MKVIFSILLLAFSCSQLLSQEITYCVTYSPGDPGTGCTYEEIVWPDPNSWYPCCFSATGTVKVVSSVNGGGCTANAPAYTYRVKSVSIIGLSGISTQVRHGLGINISTVFQTNSSGGIVTQTTFTRTSICDPDCLFFWFNFKLPTNIAVNPGVAGTAIFTVERSTGSGWVDAFTMSVPVKPLQKPYFTGDTEKVQCSSSVPAAFSVTVNRNIVNPLHECEPNSSHKLVWTVSNGWLINGQSGPVTTSATTVTITQGSSTSLTAEVCAEPETHNWYIPNNKICKTLRLHIGPPATPTDIYLSSPNCSSCTWNTAVLAVPGATSYSWTGGGAVLGGLNGPQIEMGYTHYLCVYANNVCGTSAPYCEFIYSNPDPCSNCRGGWGLSKGDGETMQLKVSEESSETISASMENITDREDATVKNLPIASVYPNPANAYETLVVELSVVAENQLLRMMDAYGRIIYIQSILSEWNEVQLQNIPPGVYFLQILQNEQIIGVQKVLVQ